MANVCVIGLGKLGACLAAVLSNAGHNVVGVDTNDVVVTLLSSGVAPVQEPGLQELIDSHPFKVTQNYREGLIGSDIAFIVVPTPSLADGSFDDRFVREAMKQISAEVKSGPKVAVVCSTVMPGTCRAITMNMPSQLSLVYSPEFIAIGSVIHDMRNPDLVLIGHEDEDAAKAVEDVLARVWSSTPQVRKMSFVNAELAKLAVNSYVTMKISFANELAAICEDYRYADARVVLDAIGQDTRIGPKYLKPGTAFGGPCFPRDNRAYRSAANVAGVNGTLARATDMVNVTTLQRAIDFVGDRERVAILGLSYKTGTGLSEASAGLLLARSLLEEGKEVWTYDPKNSDIIFSPSGKHTNALSMADEANGMDVVLVMTPWDAFRNFKAAVPTYDCWGITQPSEQRRVVGVGWDL